MSRAEIRPSIEIVSATTFVRSAITGTLYGSAEFDDGSFGRPLFGEYISDTMAPDPTTITWGVWDFCAGIVGVAYGHEWDLEGLASPTTYTLIAGALPNGLALQSVTGNQGRIHGTPTAAGTFTFTLRATNSLGATDKVFSIVIAPAPSGGSAPVSFAY
ncbi:MAG TPA: Ig domain-containing protein [Clostridia bacterium]|nr:Ig domain-containing protein [Clostridia bacterium]